jgi:hypothetical protein
MGDRPGVCGAQVVLVDIRTLKRLRAAIDSAEPEQIEQLRADLDHLIDAARWNGEPL